MKNLLLDSGVVGAFINRRGDVFDRLRSAVQQGDRIGTCVPIIAEIAYGIENSASRDRNLQILQRNLSSLRITTEIEHSSIKSLCEVMEDQGTSVCKVPTDRFGRIDAQQLAESLTPDTTLVSVHWVNNETGVIQPVEEIARLCRDCGVLFHTDASQAVGKLPVDVEELGCDFLSFSAHKFHGPQGVGGLYVRPGVKLAQFIFGGSQESGRRAGTENLPGIAGAGAAAGLRLIRLGDTVSALRERRDRFERAVLTQIPDVFVNGDKENRICNTTNLQFEGVDGEAFPNREELARICGDGL